MINLIDQVQRRYRSIRNKYVTEIRKSKQQSWRDFVTTETSKDMWSLPYKIIRDKIKKDEVITSLTLEDGTCTSTWEDTIKAFLNKCVPEDDKLIETNRHRDILTVIKKYKNYNVENVFTIEEIDMSINRLKNRTAPGVDKFTTEIIKKVWKAKPQIIYNLLNNCFKNGIFPKLWKTTKLKIILKDKNKDKKLLNSYRSIFLIPTMSKVFERVVTERLQVAYRMQSLESPNQYGFKKDKSTEDAISHVLESIKCTEKKYVVALFIDIQGAFDSLWWPAILRRLIEANCSSALLRIVSSYFKSRRVTICSKYRIFDSKMEKGCPQGSIIGPMFWNWCMNSLLNNIVEMFAVTQVDVVAYANDVVALVKGDSRIELERVADALIKVVIDWCEMRKLRLAAGKTVAMLLKGRLDKYRSPIIKIYGTKIKFANQTKYLGVVLDERLNFINYAKYIRDKLVKIVMAIKRIARKEWGIKQHG